MGTKHMNWESFQLYAGIDLHKNKWVITVRTKESYITTFVIPPSAEILLRTFHHKWPGAKIKAVYEAGCFGYTIAEFLIDHGVETMIVAPHRVPIASGNFVKTDKIDSKRLATELANGSLQSIYLRNQEELYERNLIRKRLQLVKRRKQLQVQLKADLLFYNIPVSIDLNKYISKKSIQVLRDLNCRSSYINNLFTIYIDEYERVKNSINQIDKWLVDISQSSRHRKKFDLLRTVPGIGRLTAITILLEIGDIKRFSSAEKFSSYLGLTPSEYSSGDKIRKGSLSGMGHIQLRSLLIECSWWSIKKDPVLLEKFYKLSVGKGKCQAIVAIARKLAVRIRYVLMNEQPYVVGVVG